MIVTIIGGLFEVDFVSFFSIIIHFSNIMHFTITVKIDVLGICNTAEKEVFRKTERCKHRKNVKKQTD